MLQEAYPKKILTCIFENIPVLVDGTQGAPHLKLDMQKLGCDFYVISCHKIYGPNGLGILYGKKMVGYNAAVSGGGGMMMKLKKKTLPLPKALRNLKQELCKQQKL